ncbi:MAG TPA: hypothetical protein VNO33_08605 [Kofleriaceae bacterium]|nr:hypothetical protein [Kofleriaceae bacterium]
MQQVENEYLGGRKSKVWTYIILLVLLIVGVVIANFAWSNPEMARSGVTSLLGLPPWAFPVIVAALGLLIFWLGLKIESDWPEALGALLIAGSVAAGEMLVGWNHFALGGLAVVPYVIPVVVFLILLGIGVSRSR